MYHHGLALAGVAFSLSGCLIACDCALSTIDIAIVDAAGEPVPVELVQVNIDGGPWEDAECRGPDIAGEPCAEWFVPVSADGDYEIQVLDGGEVLATDIVEVVVPAPSPTQCCRDYFNAQRELVVDASST